MFKGEGPRVGELAALQYLRAVAAIMVVGFHAFGYVDTSGRSIEHASFLLGGVDLFFVISGFVMWTSTAGRDMSPLDFYRRRVIRIVPLYWLLTSVLVVVMLVKPQLLRTASFDLGHVIASYAFLAWPHPTAGQIFPVLVPGWTLNYEMAFYAIFGALLLLPRNGRLPALVLTAALTGFAGLYAPRDNPWAVFYSDTIIFEFAAGACLGRVYMETRAGGRLLPALTLAVGAALLVTVPTLGLELPRALAYGPAAIMVVAGAAWLERAGGLGASKPLKFLGDASYSIYLAHPIALAAFAKLGGGLALAGLGAKVGFYLALVGAAVVCGVALYLALERPMLRALKPRRACARAARAVPAAA